MQHKCAQEVMKSYTNEPLQFASAITCCGLKMNRKNFVHQELTDNLRFKIAWT